MSLARTGQPIGQPGDNKTSDNWTPLLTHDKLGMTIRWRKKKQPRICQQEFLNEGSLQPAHQSFSVLNKNLAQIVAPCA